MWCQDQVLDVLNHTAELATRGLAAILLQKNGDVHDSRSVWPGLLVHFAEGMSENRISLGSRGDSFYAPGRWVGFLLGRRGVRVEGQHLPGIPCQPGGARHLGRL